MSSNKATSRSLFLQSSPNRSAVPAMCRETEVIDDIRTQHTKASKLEGPHLDATVVQSTCQALHATGSCPICMYFMSEPYILECGHTACATCLRRVFERLVLKRLGTLRFESHDYHDQGECQVVPKTDEELVDLIGCVEAHGMNPADIFIYECPICRNESRRPPVVNVGLTDVLMDLLRSYKGQYIPEYSRELKLGDSAFQGLFLTQGVCEASGLKFRDM
ncbi:hypothetical protein D9611_009725 [Ephemerocybe angulata]|uniref:RING-type domain-containing protein n=1 Tax=Ephemerocybe angulata TaxID=980116 RepID=A0A8H5C602_9AGAR|nr:hypothetical protein D9611_009725 [Tulosesus angulatus]